MSVQSLQRIIACIASTLGPYGLKGLYKEAACLALRIDEGKQYSAASVEVRKRLPRIQDKRMFRDLS